MGSCSSAMKSKRAGNDIYIYDNENNIVNLNAVKRSDSDRSYSNRNTLNTTVTSSPKGGSRKSTENNNNFNVPPKAKRKIGLLPKSLLVCDDFNERPKIVKSRNESKQRKQKLDMDKSLGYYTSSSCPSTPRKSSNPSTQDQNEVFNCSRISSTSTASNFANDLKMEMYLMSTSETLMSKTSSPISQRHLYPDQGKTEVREMNLSKSYVKWRTYLQTTPDFMVKKVTHIPEAIAGNFCPPDYPAFIDLNDMESAAKRFKYDAPREEPISYLPRSCNVTFTTDL